LRGWKKFARKFRERRILGRVNRANQRLSRRSAGVAGGAA
jgi:hypothetical protein